jgi:hypothetical protein
VAELFSNIKGYKGILAYNNLSEEQARHLPIGYEIRVPGNAVLRDEEDKVGSDVSNLIHYLANKAVEAENEKRATVVAQNIQ